MSKDIRHQNQEHIAGEPASSQAKPIPPLNGNQTTSQRAVKTPHKKPRKVLQVIQIFSIIVALILSAYSVTIIWSLPDQAGQSGADANEVLVIFVADDGQTGHELHIYSPLMFGDEWLIW